ncbi:MAG: hypothetical protein ACLFQV_01880 [Vulcanimicrobiota bacterium]
MKIYSVEATAGPAVASGQTVKKGQVLGRDIENRNLTADFSGKIKKIQFNGKDHCFEIYLEELPE